MAGAAAGETGRFDAVGARLFDEHRRNEMFRPFAAESGIASLADAYEAQATLVSRLRQAGEPAGYKIGLTSKRMQEMCGIDVPVAGVVLGSRVHESGAELRLADFGRLGLEFEICVTMGKDQPPADKLYTPEEIAAAVGSVAAAVELVDDRNCDYASLDVMSLVADNSWNAGVVLGEPVPAAGIDLIDCEGIVTLDGAELDRGHGRDALGGPLIPLEWLANHLRATGQGLRAGDIVMTGSLIPTQFPKGQSRYGFTIAGIGAVEVAIAE
jgi:2-keto-4-pentenoate hydratase